MDVSMRSILLVLLCCHLYTNSIKVEGFSKEEDFQFEKQLTQLNKPKIMSIGSKYGVLYDCVDFYKQPAFDHPSLKNHDFHFQMKPSSVPRTEKMYVANITRENHVKMEVIDCPFGTVPIRRVTKADVIRNKLHEKRFGSEYSMLSVDNPGTHYAVVQTKLQPGVSYNGGGASISVYNPHVENSQYTSGRMKIENGVDSFQFGWMVNPTLYGDTLTHAFIYSSTSKAKCFNLLCPGFVLVRSDYPIDGIIRDVSSTTGQKFDLSFLLYKDESNGNWWLGVGPDNTQIGFWPQQIFTDLAGKAASVEWGGEVSGPSDVRPYPSMGNGYYVDSGDIRNDAFCKRMTTVNDAHQVVDAADTETDSDSELFYDAVDKGYVDSNSRHIMFFGGPEKNGLMT